MTTVVLSTIGDVRKFLAQFGPESDDYPFVVWQDEEPIDLVTASVASNCDGHPDYAMVVCSDLKAELTMSDGEVDPEWHELLLAERTRRKP